MSPVPVIFPAKFAWPPVEARVTALARVIVPPKTAVPLVLPMVVVPEVAKGWTLMARSSVKPPPMSRLTLSAAPLSTSVSRMAEEALPKAPEAAGTSVTPTTTPPLRMVQVPVLMFAPVSLSMPLPSLTKLVPPTRTVPMVLEALFTVILLSPMVIWPPARTMVPEADPKVILPELTVPLTAMVPAPRPAAAVPKFVLSPVVVVTLLPEMAVVPAAFVLQPDVAVPTHGAAQVPVAVPKPAVPLLLSQYCAGRIGPANAEGPASASVSAVKALSVQENTLPNGLRVVFMGGVSFLLI